jgi:hypothetical protein
MSTSLLITINLKKTFNFKLWKNSSLSWSTRIKGFIAMFALGLLCSILVRHCNLYRFISRYWNLSREQSYYGFLEALLDLQFYTV